MSNVWSSKCPGCFTAASAIADNAFIAYTLGGHLILFVIIVDMYLYEERLCIIVIDLASRPGCVLPDMLCSSLYSYTFV